MRKINPDGTLEGFEFQKGYDPYADDTPAFLRISNQDLIDFPCSPGWVRHFASLGMTPDYPPDFYLDKKREQPIVEQRWTSRQWDYVQQLKAQVLYLQSKVIKRGGGVGGKGGGGRRWGEGPKYYIK